LIPGGTGRARLDTLTTTKKPELVQQEFTIEPPGVEKTQKLYPAVQREREFGGWVSG